MCRLSVKCCPHFVVVNGLRCNLEKESSVLYSSVQGSVLFVEMFVKGVDLVLVYDSEGVVNEV